MRELYVDARSVRLVALQVLIVTLLVLYTKFYWLAAVLVVDFALRAFTYLPSPFGLPIRLLRELRPWVPKPIFAPPKKFAATLGFVFSSATAVLLFLQLYPAAYVVGGILLACAFLESALNICVGCYAYDWFIAPFKNG